MAVDKQKLKRIKKKARAFAEDVKSTEAILKKPKETKQVKIKGIELSDIVYVSPDKIKRNPNNKYDPLVGDDYEDFKKDISEKGVIVPLILML